MKREAQVVSPIAIDLGAKNTGVYFAHYPAGSSIENIEKEGKVYQLDSKSYTYLMANRTAARHQRRGYDRRQMVKRLFKLIWCEHFKLPWDKNTEQTIGFLFNRRGFSFLAGEYDEEKLSQFPEKAFNELPKELEIEPNENGEYDFADKLNEWKNAENAEKTFQEKFLAIKTEIYLQKLYQACNKFLESNEYKEGRNDRNKLERIDSEIFTRLKAKVLRGLEHVEDGKYTYKTNEKGEDGEEKEVEKTATYKHQDNKYNLKAYIKFAGKDIVEEIKTSIESIKNAQLDDKVWDFMASSFDLEKKLENAEFDPPDELEKSTSKSDKKWLKTHLHHLAFALSKTLNELESGGRHRSKYFEEVRGVLENETHTHRYLKTFCRELQSGNYKPFNSEPLNVEKLTDLIGHLSNLELKPLRKYFNDTRHKKGDYWDEERIKEIFNNWILKQWRVGEKDKDKVEGKRGDYKELCKDWEDHKGKGTVVDFWLGTDPFRTIPPYQDNNNRRPPRCQSLILNSTFLDANYHEEWQTWLRELKELPLVKDYLGNFEKQLKDLKSGKGRPYFSDDKTGSPRTDSGRRTLKQLDARVLQFIFDRVKAADPLKLNEIYSHAKKYRQVQSTAKEKSEAKAQLEDAINKSKLPDTLKTQRDYRNNAIFAYRSFLHLACKYYKLRQKARDGRIYIHPEYRFVKGRGYENTGRFDDEHHLLTYCNHKPRQKYHQSFYDVAGVLQVSPEHLQKIIGDQSDDALVKWLKGFHGLPTLCKKSADAQKKHRGALKISMDKAIRDPDKKNDLYKLNESIEKIARKIGEALFGKIDEGPEKSQEILEQKIKKFRSVFSFAQINNIAFTERSGNANNCAVCSMDNAQRMQMVEVTKENGKEDTRTKARRLPAIPTRMFDGAVMRMARIVGGAIAEDKWQKIKGELEAENHVHIPIITESNRFEFEPNLKEIKGKNLRNAEKNDRSEGQKKLSVSKDDRIKEASLGICPYTGGDPLGNAGDKDHIIPRSSEWGTLNDEANFIWASDKGNKEVKKDNEFSLAELDPKYKRKQFEMHFEMHNDQKNNDQKIEEWIIRQIGDDEGEFKFGPYRNFINLTSDQQKAFRHALFLKGHPLREKVINAIDSRTRTFVNGTQRYFAEVLANKLHKEAKRIGKDHLLSFDYFGVEAQDNSRGDGVYNLRKDLVEHYRDDLKKYDKDKINGKSQHLYSHLIDAQVAFCMVADAHQKEGSLNLNLQENGLGLWPRVDRRTGEIKPDKAGKIYDGSLFNAIQVDTKQLKPEPLERQIPKPQVRSVAHRPLFNENAVALHFLRLIEIQESNQKPKYFKGFVALSELKKCLKERNDNKFKNYEKYAVELTDDRDVKKYTPLYTDTFAIRNGRGVILLTDFGVRNVTVKVYSLDKKKVSRFLVDHFNTASDISLWHSEKKDEIKILELLYNLWYFTQRKEIIVKEKLYYLKDNDKKCLKLVNPQIEKDWADLYSSIDESQDLRTQLKDYFLYKEDNENRVLKHDHKHKRVTKEFSLPISCQKGFLIRKKNWKGEDIYYCRPASNDFSQTLLHKDRDGVIPDGNKDERLVNAYRQKNIFYSSNDFCELKKSLYPIDPNLAIDPNKYYEAQIPPEFSAYLCRVENRRTDADRPKFKFYLNEKNRMDFIEFKKFILKYRFRNLQDLKAKLRKEWVEDRISDPESLQNAIEEVEKMTKKPEKLLPTLKEIERLFEESKTNQILAYSAKEKFTLEKNLH